MRRENEGDRMKVNGFKPAGEVFRAYQKNTPDVQKNNRVSQTEGDSVELSSEAKFKKEIESTLKNLPEVREDLVNRLKRDIQAGTYQPDAHRIADGMIKERLLDKE